MIITDKMKVNQVVAMDYCTASIFESFGIDYCCKGNITLDKICELKSISKDKIIESLTRVMLQPFETAKKYNEWPLEALADYIEKKHHRYVENAIVQIKLKLDRLCEVHGERHMELFRVRDLFDQSASDLSVHMKKEELILFPAIRKLVTFDASETATTDFPFGSIENPIAMMQQDHDDEGERFKQIAALTNDYKEPDDACATYKVTLSLLKDFERDLHLHIHLENNILFPKAVMAHKMAH